jgi:hypothetical protein
MDHRQLQVPDDGIIAFDRGFELTDNPWSKGPLINLGLARAWEAEWQFAKSFEAEFGGQSKEAPTAAEAEHFYE